MRGGPKSASNWRNLAVAALATVAIGLPGWAAAQSDWLATPAVQDQLAAGEVVTRANLDEQHGRANVDAAIRIHAPAQTIWALITQCHSVAQFMPDLKRCEQLQTAADGSWAVIEHDSKYSVLTPMIHSVFRADFKPPLRMDFKRVSGDLKDEVGSWILTPSSEGVTTTVEYVISVEPGFWVPHTLVRHSLKKQLPEALVALRTHAEQADAPLASSRPADSPSAPGTPSAPAPETTAAPGTDPAAAAPGTAASATGAASAASAAN